MKCFEGRATDALEEYFEPRVSLFLAVRICLEKLRGKKNFFHFKDQIVKKHFILLTPTFLDLKATGHFHFKWLFTYLTRILTSNDISH